MPEIEDEDWLEACLIFNKASRIYHYNYNRLELKDTHNASIESQANRGVEAACIAMLWQFDPEMKRFKVETPETLGGEAMLARIERNERNLLKTLLGELERGLGEGGSWTAESSDNYDELMEKAADIMMVVEETPEEDEDTLEQYRDEFPEAVNFLTYHSFEAQETNKERERERTLCSRNGDGEWSLTESFWERSMIKLMVERPLFDEIVAAETERRREGREFTPPPAP